jgi:hypothetical protein
VCRRRPEIRAVDILGDSCCPGAAAEVIAEAVDIEPELLRVADQVAELKRVLMVEKQVVHRPERALRGRCLGGLGGPAAPADGRR